MKTVAIIEKDENGYGIFTPDLKTTLLGEGKTVEDAKMDFLNTYEEVLLAYTENGEDIPEELLGLEFSYRYDIASLFNEFNFLNATKFAQWVGISPGLMRHYKAGDTYISEAQAKKIEAGLHRMARKLLQVSL